MAEYLKAWTTVLFFALEVILLTGIIAAAVTICQAQQFHSSVMAEIENSNFNDSVISQCKTEASQKGYELTVQKVVTNVEEGYQIADVQLSYPYRIGLLELNGTGQIRGTAR